MSDYMRPIIYHLSTIYLYSSLLQCISKIYFTKCLPCPSLSPGVCSNSCPLSEWCYAPNSSSASLFTFAFNFPESGYFPMSQFFTLGDQRIAACTSASVLPMNIQGLFPFSAVQFSSVSQLCPTFWDPMNRSTPGFPVHHHLQEFTQTHVHRVSDAIQPSHPVIPFSSCPQSLPTSESLPMSQLFAWGDQSTGVSALASFLPKNTQGWSPLEWTGWISLQSKGLSRVFSNTIVQKYQFLLAT